MAQKGIASGQRDEIGRIAEAAAKKAVDELGLDHARAQVVIERAGELKDGIRERIETLCVREDYADEEVPSSYTYPPEYRPRSIREQVERLQAVSDFNGLDAAWALDQGQAWYDSLSLPDWVEGPLVYIWHECMSGGYHQLLEQLLQVIADTRRFHNYRRGQLTPAQLRQHAQTVEMERLIKVNQPGDLIIVPSQAGLRHRGCSTRRSHVRFMSQEFGLGSVAEACRTITHPERFMRWEQLHVDCAGDEFAPVADGQFVRAPGFVWRDGRLRFRTVRVDLVYEGYGSSSGFLP